MMDRIVLNGSGSVLLGFLASKMCIIFRYIIQLPKLTPDSYRVVMNGFGTYNPKDGLTATDLLKLYSTLADVNAKSDLVRGYISIYDFANVGISLHKFLLSLWTSTVRLMLVSYHFLMFQDEFRSQTFHCNGRMEGLWLRPKCSSGK